MGQRESGISQEIIKALLKAGVFAFKVHGSALMVSGLPDIIACVDGRYVGFETKVPEKRNNTSEIQELRHAQIRAAGGIAEVVCGPKEALAHVARIRGEGTDAQLYALRRSLRDSVLKLSREAAQEAINDGMTGSGVARGEANAYARVLEVLRGES